MHQIRLIVSPPADGPLNMSADEAIFNYKSKYPGSVPTLRIYSWSQPCMTIGYFQKHADFLSQGLPITRRMTGGLSVVHGEDVSFSFVLDDNSWQHVYDQEKTYEIIHRGIKGALDICGLKTEFVSAGSGKGNTPGAGNICVKTLYPYDLLSGNRKVVGSCQRRRGKTLLVQGSIHIPQTIDRQIFRNSWETILKEDSDMEILHTGLNDEENADAAMLAKTKYSENSWNNKY